MTETPKNEGTTYAPGRGPGAVVLSGEALSRLLGAHLMGALAANKRNGHPHLTTVAYSWDAVERVIRISTTADRAKVGLLRKDPRGALHVTTADYLSYVVAEGVAELSEVSTEVGDETGRELLGMRAPFDSPRDETTFLEHMVADRRLVIRLRVSRLYGSTLDVPAHP